MATICMDLECLLTSDCHSSEYTSVSLASSEDISERTINGN